MLRNFRKPSNKEIPIDAIQKIVCGHCDLPYDNLLGKSRKREIAEARQVAMFLAKVYTTKTLKAIGEHFGGHDHTTVIRSYRSIQNRMDADGLFREKITELRREVQLVAMQ